MKELSDNNFLVLPREKFVRFLNDNAVSDSMYCGFRGFFLELNSEA